MCLYNVLPSYIIQAGSVHTNIVIFVLGVSGGVDINSINVTPFGIIEFIPIFVKCLWQG